MRDKIFLKTSNNKDIAWINTAKAVCMLLVYINHCEFYANGSFFYIRPFYRLFFVNLFFIVSGYLFFRKQLTQPTIDEQRKEFVKGTGKKTFANIIFRIFIPTILFGILFFIPKIIVRGTGFDVPFFLKDVFLGNWSWFTSTLFVSELLLVILLLTRVRNISFYLIISIILGVFAAFLPHESNVVWHWQSGACALSLLVLGGIFWKCEKLFDKIFGKPVVLITTLILYCYVVYFSGWQLKWFVSDFNFTLLGLVVMIAACVIMIYICKILPRIGWLDYIGKNSLVFYMLCGGYPNIMAVLLQRISANSTLNVFVSSLLSIVLAYISTMLINKYLPFLIDLRSIQKRKKEIII